MLFRAPAGTRVGSWYWTSCEWELLPRPRGAQPQSKDGLTCKNCEMIKALNKSIWIVLQKTLIGSSCSCMSITFCTFCALLIRYLPPDMTLRSCEHQSPDEVLKKSKDIFGIGSLSPFAALWHKIPCQTPKPLPEIFWKFILILREAFPYTVISPHGAVACILWQHRLGTYDVKPKSQVEVKVRPKKRQKISKTLVKLEIFGWF